MGLTKAVERRSQVINGLHPRDPGIVSLFGFGNQSAAGVAVNPTTATAEDTLFAAERYLSETIAALPLGLYRRLEPRGRQVATDHWLYQRLHNQPNQYMAKYRFWRLLMNWMFYRGNMRILIQPSTVMPPFEFWPLHPDRIRLAWDGDTPYYEYTTPKNGVKELRYGEVMSVAFMPGEDGFTGKSVISYQIDTIGRALAAERYQGKLSANHSNPSGVLKHKKTLSRDASKLLREDWEEIHGGPNNAGKVAILQEDMEWQPVTMTNDDAQAVEMLQLNSEAMARIARVPQHKVGLLGRATFSNIEHQAIEAVQDSILPICVNIEGEIWLSLIPAADKATMYAKHNVDGLLRGDFLSRQQGLEIQRRNGVIDGDTWAEREEMNPFDGGDKRYVPLNWVDINAPPPPPAPPLAVRLLSQPSETRSLVSMHRLRTAFLPIIEDAFRRLVRREADAVERQFRRHAQERSLSEFLTWLSTYHDEHRNTILQGLAPAMASYVEMCSAEALSMIDGEPTDLDGFTRTLLAASASRYLSESRTGVMAAIDGDAEAIVTRMEALLHDWRNGRAVRISQRESVDAGNATSRHVWIANGVPTIQWRKGASCVDCGDRDGQTVDIRGDFGGDLLHPPFSDGCDCQIIPGGMS